MDKQTIIEIDVDHANHKIDVRVGRPCKRTGAYSYNVYLDISIPSQQRILRCINSCYTEFRRRASYLAFNEPARWIAYTWIPKRTN